MFGYIAALLSEKGRQIYTTTKTATVAEAVREMNDKGVGALLVVERGRPAGIITERDVLKRIVDADRDPALTKVAQVMTRDPQTIDIGARVDEAMALMTARRFRHLPVLEHNEIVGLISIGDVLRWVALTQEEHIRTMSDYITGRVEP
jgi:CBS domain-containing protein